MKCRANVPVALVMVLVSAGFLDGFLKNLSEFWLHFGNMPATMAGIGMIGLGLGLGRGLGLGLGLGRGRGRGRGFGFGFGFGFGSWDLGPGSWELGPGCLDNPPQVVCESSILGAVSRFTSPTGWCPGAWRNR